jgi:hypothetical protein
MLAVLGNVEMFLENIEFFSRDGGCWKMLQDDDIVG